MTASPSPPHRSDTDPPDILGLRTWRDVYLVVFGWFVLVVAALALFGRVFS